MKAPHLTAAILSLLVAGAGLVGCSKAKEPAKQQLARQEPANITATPNPVPAGGGPGTTTLSWNTGDGSVGQVYVSVDGKPETLFAQDAKKSKDAAWIRAGATYEFRLYAGLDRAKLLNKVVVTREK